MDEVLRAIAVGLGFVLILAAAEAWQRWARPPVELSRKFVHFLGGLAALSFPWVFTNRWTVLALATVSGLIIWGTRRLGLLRSVHGVARASEGGILFPLAVALLFIVAHDRPAFYLVSALTLVVSDAAAAVLGSTYGRTTYVVEEDRRSFEGSVSFFVTTFIAAHVPLLLMTDMAREVSVLLALHVALIVTLIEGVSLRGSDNLLVPMATYYLLDRFATASAGLIASHSLVLVASLALLSALCLRSRLMRLSGVMAACLFFYAVYLLGGAGWMGAPALALLALAVLRHVRRGSEGLPDARYQVLATAYAISVAMALLIAREIFPDLLAAPEWLVSGPAFEAPFVGVIAGQLAIVSTTQYHQFTPRERAAPSLGLIAVLALGASGAVVPAGLLLVGVLSPEAVLVAASIVFLAAGFYWTGRRTAAWPAVPPWNMALQTASTAAAAALILPLHFRLLAAGG